MNIATGEMITPVVTNPYKGLWGYWGNDNPYLSKSLRIPIRGYEANRISTEERMKMVTNPYKGLWGAFKSNGLRCEMCYESL